MGAYSPLPQRDKYIFLTGGVLYIYTLPREYRKEKSQQIKNAREQEKMGEKRSICEIFGDIRR